MWHWSARRILQLEQQSKVADSVSVVGRWANVEALLADAQVPSVDIIAAAFTVCAASLIAQVKDLALTAQGCCQSTNSPRQNRCASERKPN